MISSIGRARKFSWSNLTHVHFHLCRGQYHTTIGAQGSKINQLFYRIMQLDVVEVRMLTNELQKRLGTTEDIGMALNSAAVSAAPTSEPVVEAKTTFDLKLIGYQENAKIKVIKEVRSIAGLGLKEAKDLVESVPKIFQKGLKEQEANEIKAKLEALGAVVELS
jgi:large subunit ribosomal protein L7/L12